VAFPGGNDTSHLGRMLLEVPAALKPPRPEDVRGKVGDPDKGDPFRGERHTLEGHIKAFHRRAGYPAAGLGQDIERFRPRLDGEVMLGTRRQRRELRVMRMGDPAAAKKFDSFGRRARVDRQRQVFATAFEACASYKEFPFGGTREPRASGPASQASSRPCSAS
jgi:hypothetical protein